MEATLNSKRIEQLIEQPDLYEIYQELEGTIGGITLPLKDLAKMCPIDLNDPRISLEDKNKFVVTGLNNAHAEINPEHETIFENTLEAQGRQRNFIIAKQDTPENLKVTQLHNPEAQLNKIPWPVVKSNNKKDKLPPAIIFQEISSLNNDSSNSNDDNSLRERVQGDISQTPDLNNPESKLVAKNLNFSNKDEGSIKGAETPISYTEASSAPERSKTLQDSRAIGISELKSYNPEVVDEIGIIDEPSGNDLDQLNIALASKDQQIWENLGTLSELPISEEDFGISEAIDLEYEELSIVNKFQVRLLNFMNISSAQEHNEQNNIMPVKDTLAIKIIEGIDNVNPELLPSLKTILEEIDRSLDAIITKDYLEEDKLINDIQMLKIQELTTQLFELCKINCSDSEKNDFIALLLNPEFKIPPINLVAVDLENMGTREVKRKQKVVTSNLGTIRDKIQRIIGDFVLSFELIIDTGLKCPI